MSKIDLNIIKLLGTGINALKMLLKYKSSKAASESLRNKIANKFVKTA